MKRAKKRINFEKKKERRAQRREREARKIIENNE
jgi:hypothetical protein